MEGDAPNSYQPNISDNWKEDLEKLEDTLGEEDILAEGFRYAPDPVSDKGSSKKERNLRRVADLDGRRKETLATRSGLEAWKEKELFNLRQNTGLGGSPAPIYGNVDQRTIVPTKDIYKGLKGLGLDMDPNCRVENVEPMQHEKGGHFTRITLGTNLNYMVPTIGENGDVSFPQGKTCTFDVRADVAYRPDHSRKFDTPDVRYMYITDASKPYDPSDPTQGVTLLFQHDEYRGGKPGAPWQKGFDFEHGWRKDPQRGKVLGRNKEKPTQEVNLPTELEKEIDLLAGSKDDLDLGHNYSSDEGRNKGGKGNYTVNLDI